MNVVLFGFVFSCFFSEVESPIFVGILTGKAGGWGGGVVVKARSSDKKYWVDIMNSGWIKMQFDSIMSQQCQVRKGSGEESWMQGLVAGDWCGREEGGGYCGNGLEATVIIYVPEGLCHQSISNGKM